ncbi:MAG: response regulator [Candidatus Dadabacteria bacterium]|nr:MAG: response regulator [Candidatus Dadabacteria bacterium]
MKVVACTHCDTRYRLDPAKFDKPRLRIRCKKCGEPFDVDLSEPEVEAPTAPPQPEPPAPAAPQPNAEAAAPAPSSATDDTGTGDAIILIAHANPDVAAEIQSTVAAFAKEVHITDNGVDALMYIETHKPQIAILDVALPKMFGFEVCEIVRRDEELSGVRVVLVAAIYDESRYKRPPSSLYGADDYIEKHRIPDELQEKISRLLGAKAAPTEPQEAAPTAPPADTTAPAASPAVSEPAPPSTAPAPPAAEQTPEPASPPPADGDEQRLERARRLARTIISDIALYNTDKIDEAVSGGDPEVILADELAEGAQLFTERIAPEVRDVEPFLLNALRDYIDNKRREAGQ